MIRIIQIKEKKRRKAMNIGIKSDWKSGFIHGIISKENRKWRNIYSQMKKDRHRLI